MMDIQVNTNIAEISKQLSGKKISCITMKSIKARRFFYGVPTILIENNKIIEAENGEKLRRITIDVNDGMSIITHYPDGKEIGVKYMDNKDDFEYIGKISELDE